MVCVEGDASMRSFEDSEGKKHSSLSVVQRKYPFHLRSPSHSPIQKTQSTGSQTRASSPLRLRSLLTTQITGSIEVLKRPYNAEAEAQEGSQ